MSNVILELFDASRKKTQVWFNDLMAELDWEANRTKPIWPCEPCSTPCAIG